MEFIGTPTEEQRREAQARIEEAHRRSSGWQHSGPSPDDVREATERVLSSARRYPGVHTGPTTAEVLGAIGRVQSALDDGTGNHTGPTPDDKAEAGRRINDALRRVQG